MLWLYLIGSYFVGTVMFGYLVIKLFHRKDIRLQGSGNVGARNAGRLHGKKAFVLIFLGDALKGVIVVMGARFLDFPDTTQLLGFGLVIIGHIKPITLRFQGGKGISTFIGGIIAFEPLVALLIVIGFIALYPFTKSFTFAGLGAFLLIPVLFVCLQYDELSVFIISFILLIILIAHSENIMERLKAFGRKK
jgi:acyl phosphate:glycerol-3-phosphate acyltransferase